MLQYDRSHPQAPVESDEIGLDPSYYLAILRKRIYYIIIPFVLVLATGSAAAMLWPPTYLSEGKLLVESQQIPVDLVRPTVTAGSKERIQVIEQRVMTRDNLLAIMDKYQMFAERRDRLSRTELLDLIRENTVIKPIELDQTRGRTEGLSTIALTVGFTDRRPDVATKVANELLTLFLNEDVRNRTNRAMETTKFLAREAQRLENDLGSVEAKIADLRRKNVTPLPEQTIPQLATLKAELAQKSSVYSKTHPEVLRLKRQIASLEQVVTPTPAAPGAQIDTDALEALQAQKTSLQKSLETAGQKLSAARLGETLERDQFAERLQVLEQAVMPQKPIKPDRIKILGLVFAGAVMAGCLVASVQCISWISTKLAAYITPDHMPAQKAVMPMAVLPEAPLALAAPRRPLPSCQPALPRSSGARRCLPRTTPLLRLRPGRPTQRSRNSSNGGGPSRRMRAW